MLRREHERHLLGDAMLIGAAAHMGAKRGVEKGVEAAAAHNPAPPTAPPPSYYGAPPPPAYYTAPPVYAPPPPAGTVYYAPAPAPVCAPPPAPVYAAAPAPPAPAPAAPSPQPQPSSPKALLLNPKEIKKWDAQTVQKFLESIHMPSAVIEKFAEADITGEDLLENTADDIHNDLGIGKLQARKIIRSLGLSEEDEAK